MPPTQMPNPTIEQVNSTYDHTGDSLTLLLQNRSNEQIFAGVSKGHQTITSIQQQRTHNLTLLTNLSRNTATPVCD